jgi:hypothetical protein
MKALHRGRPAQMVMLSALLSWSAAAPAVADEVTYLTYLKGTEGKVAPFRVQWNEVDDAKGRITIDLGTPYEAWLKKLGLGRVQAFDAKLNRQEFVVRDPLLTRFVTIVASDLVRGAQTNVLPGVTPITTGAQVEGAVLLITPAPDNLEVIARLAFRLGLAEEDQIAVDQVLDDRRRGFLRHRIRQPEAPLRRACAPDR